MVRRRIESRLASERSMNCNSRPRYLGRWAAKGYPLPHANDPIVEQVHATSTLCRVRTRNLDFVA